MKKILAGIALIAAAYFVSAYNVQITVSEAGAKACDPSDPTCGG
jgi:hypothetical protein